MGFRLDEFHSYSIFIHGALHIESCIIDAMFPIISNHWLLIYIERNNKQLSLCQIVLDKLSRDASRFALDTHGNIYCIRKQK